MQEQGDGCESLLTPSLSFGKRQGDRLIPPSPLDLDSPWMIAAAAPPEPPPTEEVTKGHEEDAEDEFTFTVKDTEAGSPIAADDIFRDGRILTVYPVFGRGLFLADATEEEKPTPTKGSLRRLFFQERATGLGRLGSEEDEEAAPKELSGIPPDTYCLWTPGPSPSRRKKSGSTWSPFRRRIRDLVMRRRSQSDEKETFVFFPAEKKAPEEAKEKNRKANSVEVPHPRRSFDAKMPTAVPVVECGKRKGVIAGRRSVGHSANEEEMGGRQPFELASKQEEEVIGVFVNAKA